MTKLSDSTREWAKRAHLALLSPSSITSSARRPCLWCPGQCFLCWVKHFALIPSSHSHYSAQHNTAKGRVRDVLLRSSSSAQLFLQILYFFPPTLMFPYRAQAGACAEHRARPRGSAGTAHRAAVSPPAPCPSALPLSFILQLLCPHSPCTMRLEQLWFHSYLSLHCSVQFLPSDPFCLLSYLPD